MKRLLFVVLIACTHHMHPSASKPVLSKAVADSGFGKAVDAGNFQEVYNLIAHNRISGFPDRQNALAYLFMTVDMANLSKDDQNTILSLLTNDHLPPAMASGLSITPSNRAWLEKISPAYAKNTNVIAGPAAPAVPRVPGPALKPTPAPVRAPSEDPTQIMIPGEPGINYRDVINAWNKGQWGLAATLLEVMVTYTPGKIHPMALKALLQTLLGNISYEVWAKMDAHVKKRLTALAGLYGVQTPRSDISSIPGGPSPEPAPKPRKEYVAIEGTAYSYEALMKALAGKRWDFALNCLIAFDANVPVVIPPDIMRAIVEDVLKATSAADWAGMKPVTRKYFDDIFKKYGHALPMLPASAPGPIAGAVWPEPGIKEDRPSYEETKKAWLTREWKTVLKNLQIFEANPGLFTKLSMGIILGEMVRDTPFDEWRKIRPEIKGALEALLKKYGVGKPQPPLPPIPGPKPLPAPKPLPQPPPGKKPAPAPGPLPPLPLPIEGLYKKMDVALKGDNIRSALEIIIKEARAEEIKPAVTRILMEVHPSKLWPQKDRLKSIFDRLPGADQDELLRTFALVVKGREAQALAKFLAPGAAQVGQPAGADGGAAADVKVVAAGSGGGGEDIPVAPPLPGDDGGAAADVKKIGAGEPVAPMPRDFAARFEAAFKSGNTPQVLTVIKSGNREEKMKALSRVLRDIPSSELVQNKDLLAAVLYEERKDKPADNLTEADRKAFVKELQATVKSGVDLNALYVTLVKAPPRLSDFAKSKDAELIKSASSANFDEALKLLDRVVVTDSDDFRNALANLFGKRKDRISEDQANQILNLLEKAYEDDTTRAKVIDALPTPIKEALSKVKW